MNVNLSHTESAKTDRLPAFDSLEQQAFLELWKSYDCLKAVEERLFDRFELSSQQYNALRILQAVEPASLSVSVLGQRMVTRAPDMTRLLDKLEQRGLIQRVRRDDNRRVVEVSLAKAGVKLLRDLAGPVRECSQQQLGHMSDQQLKSCISLMKEARRPHQGASAQKSDGSK